MPKTYTQDAGDIGRIADRIIETFFPLIREAGLTLEILLCHGGLILRGWPAYATIKANSLKDRVAGLQDVRIVVDADRWEDLTEDRKAAIIHHELYHVDLKVDGVRGDVTVFATDDCGRPVVKLKPHDFEFGGFDAIAAMYGPAAPEYAAYVAAARPGMPASADAA